MAPLPGMPPCGCDDPLFFSSVHVGTAGSVGATFMSPAWVRCCAACAPSCLVGVCLTASCAGRHKWRPYRVCRRAVVVARRFFIRMCGNHRQRRGDIHVARVRALLHCVGAVVSRRCLPRRSCAGRHKWRPYRVCRRAVVVVRRFFIRMCGNRRQRRGDIHVARERALLRCVRAVVA